MTGVGARFVPSPTGSLHISERAHLYEAAVQKLLIPARLDAASAFVAKRRG